MHGFASGCSGVPVGELDFGVLIAAALFGRFEGSKCMLWTTGM
jgi:hypothetical protein